MAIAREVIEAPDLLPLPFPGISPSITVGTIVGLMASGSSRERILQAYPQLEPADIDEALAYAAWRLEEREEALVLN